MAKAKNKSRSKTNKYAQHSKQARRSIGRVVKGGVYDGSEDSESFVVGGHSTGAANTEMEAMSHDVSRAAGAIPAYETDANYREAGRMVRNAGHGVSSPLDDFDREDLGGPELYGNKPSLLSDVEEGVDYRKIALWSTLGVAGAALVGYAAYRFTQRANQ